MRCDAGGKLNEITYPSEILVLPRRPMGGCCSAGKWWKSSALSRAILVQARARHGH